MLESEHFHVSEFDCHDGTSYPEEWVDTRLQRLVNVLDPVRDRWKGPIFVRSGLRTDEWNKKVGGAPHSQHLEGTAADVYPKNPKDADKLHDLILEMYLNGELPELGGLGRYPNKWVHVDVRERPASGHLAQWTGSGIGSEQTA